MAWKEIKRIAHAHRELSILEGPNGLFRFDTFKWIESCEEDEGALGDGYWSCDHQSGYYDSATAAEADARQKVPWLTDVG